MFIQSIMNDDAGHGFGGAAAKERFEVAISTPLVRATVALEFLEVLAALASTAAAASLLDSQLLWPLQRPPKCVRETLG